MTPEARIEGWFRRVLQELDPRKLTAEARVFAIIDSRSMETGIDRNVRQGSIEPGEVVLVAIGKAAIAMGTGAQERMGDRFRRGFVLTVDGPDATALDRRWTVFRAGHPIPDQRGIDATRSILEVVESLDEDDLVVVLLSGGGSALFEAPRAPLTLYDFAGVTQSLLNAGAPIHHLNTVRIPLSRVKGGSFRRRSPAGRFATVILSDVLGNDIRIIASGPTVEPTTSGAAALATLDLYGLRDAVSPTIRTALNEAAIDDLEWQHPDDIVEIVGDLHLALSLARNASARDGCRTLVVDTPMEGEAATLARDWVQLLTNAPPDIDIIWGGGEATVTVRGQGIGGRNTEFALAAALELDRLGRDDWVVASLATDGQDGTTGSAGAVASRCSIVDARSLGIDPLQALASNDSATLFQHVGGLVVTGPSGTNVNDLYVGFRRTLE